jgi:hypothetical protein
MTASEPRTAALSAHHRCRPMPEDSVNSTPTCERKPESQQLIHQTAVGPFVQAGATRRVRMSGCGYPHCTKPAPVCRRGKRPAFSPLNLRSADWLPLNTLFSAREFPLGSAGRQPRTGTTSPMRISLSTEMKRSQHDWPREAVGRRGDGRIHDSRRCIGRAQAEGRRAEPSRRSSS